MYSATGIQVNKAEFLNINQVQISSKKLLFFHLVLFSVKGVSDIIYVLQFLRLGAVAF